MGHSLCSFILRQIPRRSPTHNAVYFTTTRLGGYSRNVLFRKISRAEVYRVHSIVLYFPMCFFRAGRKNFTVFTTLDFSTAFLLPSQSIYSEIKPKCRSASLIASTFSGGQG